MIGTMGSFAYPSADLNDPLYVLFHAVSCSGVAESKPQGRADQDVQRDCYLHGYVSAGLMKRARESSEGGLAITIAATKVDGIVLSLTPNSHSYNYRSAVLFGHGSIVEACILSKQNLSLSDLSCEVVLA